MRRSPRNTQMRGSEELSFRRTTLARSGVSRPYGVSLFRQTHYLIEHRPPTEMRVDNTPSDRSPLPKKSIVRVWSQRFEIHERGITELVMRRLLLIEILDELRTEKLCADDTQRQFLIELAHERLPRGLASLASAAGQAPRMAGAMADDNITITCERHGVRLREGRKSSDLRTLNPRETNTMTAFVTPDMRDGTGCAIGRLAGRDL